MSRARANPSRANNVRVVYKLNYELILKSHQLCCAYLNQTRLNENECLWSLGLFCEGAATFQRLILPVCEIFYKKNSVNILFYFDET
jgi:hypothetical protein